jgi:hypothetical protein
LSPAGYIDNALDELADRTTGDGQEDWLWKMMKALVRPLAIRDVLR